MAVRVGLIGCGKIGQKHLQALAHLPDLALIATADPDLARAEAAAVPFDAKAYASPKALLTSGSLDAVLLATPSGLHPELAMMAMEQGLDVLVEKPLALSWAEAKALTQFADDAGLILAVTHFNRMLPAVSRVLTAVREGKLGRLLSGGVAVRWSRPQAYYDEAPWRGTRAMDGGILFNQAIHALDLAVQAFGAAQEAFAFLATLTHAIEAEDVVAGAIRFESGALCSVAVTTSVPATNLEERLTLIGSDGIAVLGPQIAHLQILQGTDGEEADAQVLRELEAQAPLPTWKSHWNALQDFAVAVQNRTEPALSAASTLHVLALVEAMTRSGLERRPIALREIEGSP